MRAAVYARYSTENQSDASIEDQVEICRRLCEAQGWKMVGTYEDRALSGASRFRPGLQKLLRDAEAKRFDVVVAEHLDRLSRNLSDVAGIYDRLTFMGIKFHTHSQGEITPIHIGLLGTMAQQYLADLRDKTKRGLLGRVRKGLSAGGLAFGYRVDPNVIGVRHIDPAEAAIVRRIFRDFAAGKSPRAIAKQLNAEGVPGPSGKAWRDTTIRGQRDRGTGFLNNELYNGKRVWNRTGYAKNPATGKRVARVRKPEEWELTDVPELRIIDDDLWQEVKRRQEEVTIEMARDEGGNALNRAHRRKYLLSGLLFCGCCGGAYSMVGDRYGCATRKATGTCDNSVTIKPAAIEKRVLAGLKDKLLAPELVELFAQEYLAALDAGRREREANAAVQQQELASIERKIAGIMKAIEDGFYDPAMKGRIEKLRLRKAELDAELAANAEPSPVRVHPGLAALYRDKVQKLEQELTKRQCLEDATDSIRSLITRIMLTPEAASSSGLVVEVQGNLVALFAHGEFDERKAFASPGEVKVRV